jgi:hypothetical protein
VTHCCCAARARGNQLKKDRNSIEMYTSGMEGQEDGEETDVWCHAQCMDDWLSIMKGKYCHSRTACEDKSSAVLTLPLPLRVFPRYIPSSRTAPHTVAGKQTWWLS